MFVCDPCKFNETPGCVVCEQKDGLLKKFDKK